jgi:hypothetical protein
VRIWLSEQRRTHPVDKPGRGERNPCSGAHFAPHLPELTSGAATATGRSPGSEHLGRAGRHRRPGRNLTSLGNAMLTTSMTGKEGRSRPGRTGRARPWRGGSVPPARPPRSLPAPRHRDVSDPPDSRVGSSGSGWSLTCLRDAILTRQMTGKGSLSITENGARSCAASSPPGFSLRPPLSVPSPQSPRPAQVSPTAVPAPTSSTAARPNPAKCE